MRRDGASIRDDNPGTGLCNRVAWVILPPTPLRGPHAPARPNRSRTVNPDRSRARSAPLAYTPGAPDDKIADADKITVFRNATIYTATADKPLEKASLAVKGGKIVAVGDFPIPDVLPRGIEEIDLKGATIIPGLVDTHSHVGVWSRPGVSANADGNEMSGPVQPGVRAIDSINADDPGIRMATAGGVTTANIMPGSGNVIGGQTVYVKYRGRSIEEMRITAARRQNGDPRRAEDGQRREPEGLRQDEGQSPRSRA